MTGFPLSAIGERLAGHTGINELMDDLGAAFDAGGDVVMMGGGNPAHVPAIEAVWQRRLTEIQNEPGALEAMLGDYDGPRGKLRFIETFAGYLRRSCGYDIGPENVAITSGSQAGFFLLLNMLAGPEAHSNRARRILLPLAPEYIGYADQTLCDRGFRAQRPLIEERGPRRFKYHIDFERLRVADDVAVLCLSRPTNPSANVVGDAELIRLVDLCRAHDRLLIIDNAYGLPFPRVVFAAAHPAPWHDGIVLTFSLSKLGLPGTRTGIVVAAPEIIRRLSAANAVLALSNGSVGQVVSEPLFTSGEIDRLCLEHVLPYYHARCQQALGWIDELFGDDLDYRVHEPEGAFFLWIWFRGLPIDDRELYQRLKRRGVLVVQGRYFFYGLEEEWAHTHQCIRISYCQPPEKVRRGIGIIAEEVRRASRQG